LFIVFIVFFVFIFVSRHKSCESVKIGPHLGGHPTSMWDYTDRRDPTQISSDELREVEIDDSVRAVTNIKKKAFVPKVFGAVAFSKTSPRTEVYSLS
jgi:hypothetical protein